MDLLYAYAPELIVATVVFVVLSGISFLWSHSKIIRLLVGFLVFRALVPLLVMAGLYIAMFYR